MALLRDISHYIGYNHLKLDVSFYCKYNYLKMGTLRRCVSLLLRRCNYLKINTHIKYVSS